MVEQLTGLPCSARHPTEMVGPPVRGCAGLRAPSRGMPRPDGQSRRTLVSAFQPLNGRVSEKLPPRPCSWRRCGPG